MNLISNLLDRCSLNEDQVINIAKSMGQILDTPGLYDQANDLNPIKDSNRTYFQLEILELDLK